MAEDIFSEIDDDLRAERSRERLRRLAVLGLALILVAVLAIALWQYLAYRRTERILEAAPAYFKAQNEADVAPAAAAGPDAPLTTDQNDAVPAFRQLAATAPVGLATLSRLRLAALQWRGGDHAGAFRSWTAVADDAAAQPDLRGLAALLWVQHQPADADPALLKTRLRPALDAASPWRLLAQETDAFLDLRRHDVATARRKLTAISQDPAASDSERARASGVLETLEPAPAGDTAKTGAKTGG